MKNKTILICAAIILLQVLVCLYWSGQKNNYFIDELYSKGYAGGFTGLGDTGQYITNSKDWKQNEWVKNSVYKKYLIVSEDEKIFRIPLLAAVEKIVLSRNYFGLLNIAESLWGGSVISNMPSVFLNLIFFAVIQIFNIVIMHALDMDWKIMSLSLTMFGFSAYAISLVEYIRFYCLVVMLYFIIIRLMLYMWKCSDFRIAGYILAEAGACILAYLGYKDSELMMAFFVPLFFCLVLALALSKKWKKFALSIIPGIVGSIYLIITTGYIGKFIHPSNYENQAEAAVEIGHVISMASVDSVKYYAVFLAKMFSHLYFGSYKVILLFIIVLNIWFLFIFKTPALDEHQIDIKRVRPVTLISFMIWLGLLGCSTIIGKGIAICAAAALGMFMLVLKEVYGFKFRFKRAAISVDFGFMLILMSASIIYTGFVSLAKLDNWRYYCFPFVSLIIIFWFCVDRIMKKLYNFKSGRILYIIMAVFVIICVVIPFKTRKIEYLYDEDRDFISIVEANKDMDVVLVNYYYTGKDIYPHEIYDCINMMSDDSRIYAVVDEEYRNTTHVFPDEFILWSHVNTNLDEITKNLNRQGYQMEDIGEDHVSKAYICRHKDIKEKVR